MPRWRLDQVAPAIRASWSLDTCDPVDVPLWSVANPARGQCGTTAVVINDLLGGDLMLAEVFWRDGTRQGHHYWNLLPDGSEVDLTRDQFGSDEIVQPGRVALRPDGPLRRCQDQYETLRSRVRDRLSQTAAIPTADGP